MPLRKVLLRIMLWSLAFAAVTGVLAVLTQGGTLVWRVIGTGITTAVACGLLLPLSALIDREKTRSAGLLGMAAVIVEFLMALSLIWEAPRYLWRLHWEEEIALTMLCFGVAVLLIMQFLKMLRQPAHVIAARVGIVLTVAAFVTYMIATWTPYRFYGHGWWETGNAIIVLGGLAVLTLIDLSPKDRRTWRWVGIGASIVACVLWLIDIWIGAEINPRFVIFCVSLSLGAVAAHANVSWMVALASGQQWIRTGTIAAAIFTATLVDMIVINNKLSGFRAGFGVVERLAAAGGILTACGTLALAVLARMNRKVDYEPVSTDLSEMTVVCPRCRKKQSVPIGDSICCACDLRISIRIEEPRCPQCDYLLYRLTSDRCPECGTVIGGKALADA